MRRKDQEITNKKVIEEILSASIICRLGMICDGIPYVVPVNYGYSQNAIYIHSSPYGRKIDILKVNNKVCFEIEDKIEIIKKETACEWSTKYRSVIGYGTVEIITDFEEKKSGLDIIMAQHGRKEKNIYKDHQIDKMIILKLNIENISAKQSK